VLTDDAELRFYCVDTLGSTLWQNSIPLPPLTGCTNLSLEGFTNARMPIISSGLFQRLRDTIWFLMRLDSLGNDAPFETKITDNFIPMNGLSIIAYPNPFNSTVAINTFPHAEVEVFDINGHRVSIEHANSAGKMVWSPQIQLASGVYFVQVTSEKALCIKKLCC
jgi:hypothetical protein